MKSTIPTLIDLETYPLDQPDSPAWQALVQRCRTNLDAAGMFELPGFLKAQALAQCVATITPRMASASAEIRRDHNIYFLDKVDGLPDDHPALQKITTINHTLCADQLRDTALIPVYEWSPFRQFIAAIMQLPVLHLMDDELARVNVLSYRPGEALNWHFDRSEFTTTLLLQRARQDGIFQYRRGLRTDTDPNYEGVARMLTGQDPEVISADLTPGALNVFRGRNTAHRVTTVGGDQERLVAVFSLYEKPGVRFSEAENLGFYKRARALPA